MINNPSHLKVVLDRHATIVEFENNLECCETNDSDFIGKNWFETCIIDVDLNEIYDVFIDLIMGETKKWKAYKNNIRIGDKDICLDFDNEVIIKNGEYLVYSIGVKSL